MTCDEIEALLADYLGGELGDGDRRRIDEHLSGCDRCREEVDSLRGPLADLAALPEVDLAEAARRTSGLEVRRRGTGARVILAVAATLLLGIVLGRLLAPAPTAQTTQAPPPPPQSSGLHPGWVKAVSRAVENGAPPSLPPW